MIWTVPTAAQLQYPSTRRCDQTDNYYGTKVDDPYRWLESDRNNETSQWTVAQNNLTSDYFSRITYMGAIRRRLNELQNTVRYSIPFFHGGYTYYFKSVGQQGALYRTKDGDISEELFLDIDGLSDDQSTSVQGLSFSENDSLLAL
ncbi:MAG: S9 family peptidase, partial [Chitinophagia bacterium]|nr:S9 family peptidase [Chitinophagia bacterium]